MTLLEDTPIPAVSIYQTNYDFGPLIQRTEEICADEAHGDISWSPGRVGQESGVVSHHRTSLVCPLEGLSNIDLGMKNLVLELHGELEAAIWDYRKSYSLDLKANQGYLINKYGAGAEYRAHADSGADKERILSLVLFMNTPGDGGGLRFPLFDTTIPCQEGKLILFPSNFVYKHAALPVVSVDSPKYSLVTWFN